MHIEGGRLWHTTGTCLDAVCDSSLTISLAWHTGGCVQAVLGSRNSWLACTHHKWLIHPPYPASSSSCHMKWPVATEFWEKDAFKTKVNHWRLESTMTKLWNTESSVPPPNIAQKKLAQVYQPLRTLPGIHHSFNITFSCWSWCFNQYWYPHVWELILWAAQIGRATIKML